MTTIKTSGAATAVVTLDEAKLHLRVDHSDEDALITMYIAAAENICRAKTQRAIAITTFQLALDSFPDGPMELQFAPLVSVESVKYFDIDGVQRTIDPADYILDKVSEPGWIAPGFGLTWPVTQTRMNAVTVDYTAGYANVPEELKAWMLLVIAYFYENKSIAGVLSRVSNLEFADSILDTYKIGVI